MANAPNIYGQDSGWVADYGQSTGRRVRVFRKTKALLKKEIETRKTVALRNELGVAALTIEQHIDAARALRLLDGSGLTLEELAKAAIKSGITVSRTIDAVYAEYLAGKEKTRDRDDTLESIHLREGRFSAYSSGKDIAEITAQEITHWLDDSGWHGTTRNNNLRGARSLLNYALKSGYITRNPGLAVDYATTHKAPPVVFPVDTCSEILHWLKTNSPESLPYYILGMFAGVRPAETERVRPTHLSLASKTLTIDASISKTHTGHIDLKPCAIAWLKAAPIPDTGPPHSRFIFDRMKKELGIKWGSDALRKTFISYHLAAYRDQNETAMQARHRGVDLLFSTYRNIAATDGTKLLTPYAKTYWALTPSALAKWAAKKQTAC